MAVTIAACAAVLAVTSCESVTGSKALTLVRLIDASSHAPAMDAYVGTTAIANNFGPNAITGYAYLSAGQATATIYRAGTRTVIGQTSGSFLAGQEHSIYVTDTDTSFTTQVMADQAVPGPQGYISVRFLQQASQVPSLDVYFIPDKAKFADYNPVISGLTPGTTSPYVNIPIGSYDIVMVPTGGKKAAYTSPQVSYYGGEVRTLLIVNQASSKNPISVITASDAN